MNDRLQEGFLKRIRYAMKPDEAYGLIFSWDNVVVIFLQLSPFAGYMILEKLKENIPWH